MEGIFNYERDDSEDYYQILGCNESSTVEQIIAEYKAKALTCHPDKNLADPTLVSKFQKIQEAKDVLVDSVKRKDYDLWRSGGIAIPFKQWMTMQTSSKAVWHWAVPKMNGKMLESGNTQCPSLHSSTSPILHRNNFRSATETSELLRKFRNYEI